MNNLSQIRSELLVDKIPLLQERIDKINDRLKASGAPAIQMQIGEPRVTGGDKHGIQGVCLTTAEVTLSRDVSAPIGQVKLLGKTQIDPSSRFMSHTFYSQIDDQQREHFENPMHPCHCDHCGTQRNRSVIFLFETADGIFRVGSGCADDFAGLQIKRWATAYADACAEVEKFCQISLNEAQTHVVFKVDDFLREAALVIDTMGYHSAKEYGLNGSGYVAYESLIDKADENGEIHFAYSPEILATVDKVKAYIHDSEFRPEDRNNDYFVNLRNLLTFGYLTQKQAGQLSSAVRSLQIYESKQAKAEENQGLANHHVGVKGERDVLKNLRIDAFYHSGPEEFHPHTKIHFFDEDRNLIIWKKSGYHEPTIGEVVNLLATVNDHKSWYSKKYGKEVKETRVSRCVELTPEQVLEHEEKKAKKLAREAKKAAQSSSLSLAS
jgi:hypothetical protein